MLDADLLLRIRQIWEAARTQAARSVNTAHVVANWLIGQEIVEAEQGGVERAEYGARQLELISAHLTSEYGSGFSVSALRYMRLFYVSFPDLLAIHHAVRDEFSTSGIGADSLQALNDVQANLSKVTWQPGRLNPALSWTHYRTLLKVSRSDVRSFYEIEAVRNGWSARQLER